MWNEEGSRFGTGAPLLIEPGAGAGTRLRSVLQGRDSL